MKFFFRKLGEYLLNEAGRAQEELVIIAPFIKHDVLKRILEATNVGCSVYVFTRWHLSEIALGVSDLEVWELLQERPESTLKLIPSLHAKYYRFDDVCLAGSANLTKTALGWHERPNLEFLTQFHSTIPSGFESALSDGNKVTESLYLQYKQMLSEYDVSHLKELRKMREYQNNQTKGETVEETVIEFGGQEEEPGWWTPKLRHPEDLHSVYAIDKEGVTSVTERNGQDDLRHFNLSPGLDKESFKLEVGWQLLQKPVVQEVDTFVKSGERFGAVRDHLKTLPCADLPDFDATETWQALMRWLLYFLEDRYKRYQPNYSEIFERTK